MVENTDLDEFGITDFPHVDHPPEPIKRLFFSNNAIELFPCFLKPKSLYDRIKNFLSLNDLELRRNEARIKTSAPGTIIEHLHVGVVLIDLHRDAGFVLFGKKIGDNARRDYHQKKNQNNKR